MSKQTFPTGAQIAGDLGGTSASPQVTGAHFGGSDGQYMIRRSGIWAPATPAYTDLSGIPASFTPAAHASTHLGGGDDVSPLLKLSAGPPLHGYTGWTFDPVQANGTFQPAAGTVYLAKIGTAGAYTINAVDVMMNQAGTGVTALANCFLGIYDSGGTRQFASADQSSAWATGSANTVKTVTIGGGYVVTANSFVYIALLIGTQATTPFKLLSLSLLANIVAQVGLTSSTYRFGIQATSQSSLPSPSVTLNLGTPTAFWVGVR